MRRRALVLAATALLTAPFTTGCGGEPATSAAPSTAVSAATSAVAASSPVASPASGPGCASVKGVEDQYAPLFAAVYGKVQDAVKHNDQKTAVEGLQKADQLVKEWAGRLEPLAAGPTPPDVHDALVTLLDQLRQYTAGNGMNAGAVAKAAANVATALAEHC